MNLQRDILLPEAANLFDVLIASPELQGLTLLGGTALALQIGHRISLDFDFATFEKHLPGFKIDQLMSRLKAEGHQVQMITSPESISQFRINYGDDLLRYARDYVINGVKVTFFAHGKSDAERTCYKETPKVELPGDSFNLLGMEGLKVSKTLVLADRVRSRDLFDLYILMRDHGYPFKAMFVAIKELGANNDPEYYKSVLRGEIPIDAKDEGLEAVDIGEGLEKAYAFFKDGIAAYETALSAEYFRS